MKQGNAIYAEIPNNLVAKKSPRIQMKKSMTFNVSKYSR
jgi:hypothetical protein